MSTSRSLGPSAGRVKTIVPGQNFGFVHDFRRDEDVFALFEFSGQAFPNELIRYELFDQGEDGKVKLRAEDIQFYPKLEREEVLGWAKAGLGAAGLEWLKKEIARSPELIGRVFGPDTADTVKERLLADGRFPLPAGIVAQALASPRWRRHALPRLAKVKHWTPALFALLFEAGLAEGPFLELLSAALAQDPSLPLQLEGPVKVKARLIYAAWRNLAAPALLLLLPRLQPGREDALALWSQLEGQPALETAFRSHDEGRSWAALVEKRWLDGDEPLPAIVLSEPFLPGLLLAGLGGPNHERALSLLKSLPALDGRLLGAALEKLTAPADRAWALAALANAGQIPADLPADLRWQMVESGGPLTLLETIPSGDLNEQRLRYLLCRPDGLAFLLGRNVPAERLVTEGRALLSGGFQPEARREFLHWLGRHPLASDWVTAGLAQRGEAFDQALEMAAGLPAFERGFLQRVLLMDMAPEQRRALAAAITARNPELWQNRYLVSDEERSAWQAAGAPLL